MIALGGWRGGKSERGDSSSTVFIASTQEAIDSGWLLQALDYAEQRLAAKEIPVTFLPWNDAFGAGDMTAEKLVSFSSTVGAAIVVLTGDDSTESRGEQSSSPRDNLVFESGLFLSHLGFGKVLLLREKNSKVPSDLLGVNLVSFSKPDDDSPSKVAIQNLGREICEFVSAVFAKTPSDEENPVTRAITKSLERTEAHSSEIRSAIAGRPRHGDPIPMPDACMAYVDAVDEVQGAFLTTTYLDSAFWTLKQMPVIEANRKLADRVREGGTAKRLILLPQPIEKELTAQREKRRSLRTSHPKLVERMDREFNSLAKANKNLDESGFQVKVVFDHDDLWEDLPEGINFSAGDTELAVFDKDRIDIYSGFTRSGLPAAKVFDRTTHRNFKTIYELTLGYVDELWNSGHAEDFSVFEAEMQDVIEESKAEVDYEPNWLLKYDADADENDARLKREELTFVIDSLSGSEEVGRHLDLGTCTGRYLEALRQQLTIKESVGVDYDPDCIAHCKRAHQEMLRNGGFRIVDADIRNSDSLPSERFDIITCMMGTLCHLRRASERHPYDDPWQAGLENLASRLTEDGDAFVAIWNAGTVAGGNGSMLLSIYPRRSNEILLKQSPPPEEFESRLEQAKLKSVAHALIEQRLHVYHLRHA
jgi:SAM-dependent methyltransferase